MKIKLSIFPLILVVCFVGLTLPHAFACSCIETTTEQRIENAQVIFSAKLTGDIWKLDDQHIAANFTVHKVWKGAESFLLIETGDVKVVTGVDSGICGVNFIPEKDYLIFAQIDGDYLQTTSCSGSWFLDGMQDDVDTLDQIGSTHVFVDAKETKGKPVECGGPGLTSKEQCEYEQLTRQVFLPLVIAFSIIGVSVFLIWKKRK